MGAKGQRTLAEMLIVLNVGRWQLQSQVPFLTPVLYCCHSLSASGVVPKNSPTHSRSCHQNRMNLFCKVLQHVHQHNSLKTCGAKSLPGGAHLPQGYHSTTFNTYIKLASFLLDALDSTEQGAQPPSNISTGQPANTWFHTSESSETSSICSDSCLFCEPLDEGVNQTDMSHDTAPIV